MRAVGTGKHPEGRFPEGQVCDLPAALDGSGEVHPDYKSFIEDGYMQLVDPADDPGRTVTQIANSIVRGDPLNHPDDAAVAEKLTPEQALAITHTGDPGASEEQADPHTTRKAGTGVRGAQLQPTPRGTIPGGTADIGYAGGTGPRDIPRGGGEGDRGTATATKKAGTTKAADKGTS